MKKNCFLTMFFTMIMVCLCSVSVFAAGTTSMKAQAKLQSNGSVLFSWNKVAGAERYELGYEGLYNGTPLIGDNFDSTTKTSYRLSKADLNRLVIQGDTTRSCSIKLSVYAVKNGKTIASKSLSPLYIKLAAPSITKISNKKAGISLKIQAVNGAKSYVLYRKEGKGKWKKIISTKKLTYVDKSVRTKYGKKYQYYIVAQNGTLKSAKSEVAVLKRKK